MRFCKAKQSQFRIGNFGMKAQRLHGNYQFPFLSSRTELHAWKADCFCSCISEMLHKKWHWQFWISLGLSQQNRLHSLKVFTMKYKTKDNVFVSHMYISPTKWVVFIKLMILLGLLLIKTNINNYSANGLTHQNTVQSAFNSLEQLCI